MSLVFKQIEYGRRPGRAGQATATLSFEGALNHVPVELEITLPWPEDALEPGPAEQAANPANAPPSSRSEGLVAVSAPA